MNRLALGFISLPVAYGFSKLVVYLIHLLEQGETLDVILTAVIFSLFLKVLYVNET